jgi:serine/threonine protein kinase
MIERATMSLLDLVLKHWSVEESKEETNEPKETFSFVKMYYLFIQSISAVYHLNNNESIYYGDMKAANLLVTRSQQMKIGDFGISILLNLADTFKTYNLKGYNPGMGTADIESAIS